MNTDGLTSAFQIISSEIDRVAGGIAEQGSKAFQEMRYADAQSLAESGKGLLEFRGKVDALLEEWQAGIDVQVRKKVGIKAIETGIKSSPKSKKTTLRVTFADGRVIEEYFAADTFTQVIREIGLDQVESFGISVRGVPLVGSQKSSSYQQRRVDGQYIITHSSTEEKKETLEDLARRAGMRYKVHVVI